MAGRIIWRLTGSQWWPVGWLLLFALLGKEAAAGGTSRDAGFMAALNSITRPELHEHVTILASDEFEGREAGKRGGDAAGAYLVAALERLQLEPAGTDGYRQPFGNGYRNILAVLPGSDPVLCDEYLVLGAHYDHVGLGEARNVRDQPGAVHNGADDNASGTAALLEIAQACTLLPQAPRRSLIFIFFDAEEKGLLGSKHWVENPTRPLDRVKLMVNLDMVGRLRNDRVEVYGWRSAAGLRGMLSRANSFAGLDLDYSWVNRFDSDHAPFFRRSIPVLLFHTGLHEDYHKVSDDAEKINAEGMERLTRWVFEIVYDLANADEIPAFRPQVQEDSEARRREILEAPPNWQDRLGITVESMPLPGSDTTPAVLRVAKVFFQTPAAEAGIEPGDWIVAVDGQPVLTPEEFARLTLLSRAESVRLTVRPKLGQGAPEDRVLRLQGSPLRLGVQWFPDPAVPQAVLVTHVLAGSPAARCGLEPGDYVLSINGVPVDPAKFDVMIREAAEPLRLEVDRRGRLRIVEITPEGHGSLLQDRLSRAAQKTDGHALFSGGRGGFFPDLLVAASFAP